MQYQGCQLNASCPISDRLFYFSCPISASIILMLGVIKRQHTNRKFFRGIVDVLLLLPDDIFVLFFLLVLDFHGNHPDSEFACARETLGEIKQVEVYFGLLLTSVHFLLWSFAIHYLEALNLVGKFCDWGSLVFLQLTFENNLQWCPEFINVVNLVKNICISVYVLRGISVFLRCTLLNILALRANSMDEQLNPQVHSRIHMVSEPLSKP